MYELPTLNDARVLAIIGTHSVGFFEAMKELEPYAIIRASATRIEIKLKNSYIDLAKLEATFKCLNNLGYYPEAHNSTYKMLNGEQIIDLDSITINWKGNDDEPELEGK